jgi:hypothetical protein
MADLAATYTVTATDDLGCVGSSSFNTATELVINGDFEAGNTGFTTPLTNGNQYTYVTDNPSVNDELNPEGLYGVGTSGRNYHSDFWGVDHTTGTGNFMIVNGFPGSPQPIVWQETVTVSPNTDYYFSAWAISLNNAGNYAKLRFSINGVQIGFQAQLTAGTKSDDNPWKPQDRFYGRWNSGTSTTAVISIVDLQTATSGNDFGLDDISFGTLAPAPVTVSPSADSELCEDETIYLYANPEYGRAPIVFDWTGPNGFTSTDENPVIPNATSDNSGTYTVKATDDFGCETSAKSVNVTIYPKVITDAGADQFVCSDAPTVTLDGTISGGITTGVWSGGNGTFSPNPQTLNASYTPSTDEINAGTVTLTLTSDQPAGACPAVSDDMTITIGQTPTLSFTASEPLCNGGSDGSVSATVTGGQSPYTYLWSDGQTTATATGLSAGTYSLTVTEANGCSATKSIELDEPEPLVVNDPTFVAPTCYGASDGQATVSASGGTLPYEYYWDAAAGSQTTATATGLSAGTYTVTVVSAGRVCSATAVAVTVPEPDAPTLSCPQNIRVYVDEWEMYASNVTVPAPSYDANCETIEYEMTGATTGSGSGLVPSPSNFYLGTTTITYTATNLKNETVECSFSVLVTVIPPEITCSNPVAVGTDADVCTAAVNVYLPQVDAGRGITWTWAMTGATEDSGSGTIPSPYTFNKGITTISWTATNQGGSATCTQTITVTDKQDPEIVTPYPLEVCVENIETYNTTSQVLPDYYTFQNGNTLLDISISDNCPLSDCTPLIEWRIVFSDGTKFPVNGYFSGQPSTFSNNGATSFRFPGDQNQQNNLVHTVYYRVTDCNNNTSDEVSTTVTVSPRPAINSSN